MENLIISYSDKVEYNGIYECNTWASNALSKEWEYSSNLFELKKETIKKKIRSQPSDCIYCKTPLIINAINNSRGEETGMGKVVGAWWIQGDKLESGVCPNCGWWFKSDSLSKQTSFEDDIQQEEKYVEGAIKLFSLTNASIPVETLRLHLMKNPKHLCNINPTVFEKLVGDIYKDFFECEVHYLGGKGDNGIDLIAVISNQPHLLQVKRTKHGTLQKGPEVVRALLGASIISGIKHAHLVTSARTFSKSTKETTSVIQNLTETNVNIQLVSFYDLLNMMQVANERPEFVSRLIPQR